MSERRIKIGGKIVILSETEQGFARLSFHVLSAGMHFNGIEEIQNKSC